VIYMLPALVILMLQTMTVQDKKLRRIEQAFWITVCVSIGAVIG